ncbi:hypothetical protein BTH42_22885 [Burkholderia sp. SRS-W-2-2016]|nr:hypothetical protein BTH42_22885 [Burkholderia sp. SRS-W-2-2016]
MPRVVRRNVFERQFANIIRNDDTLDVINFGKGRRVRFIGDCIHGLICEGTAQTTDEIATVPYSFVRGPRRDALDTYQHNRRTGSGRTSARQRR